VYSHTLLLRVHAGVTCRYIFKSEVRPSLGTPGPVRCCQFYHTIGEGIDVDCDCGTVQGIASASEWLGEQKLDAIGFGDGLEYISSPFSSYRLASCWPCSLRSRLPGAMPSVRRHMPSVNLILLTLESRTGRA
jgi:hypothetical protein